MIARHEVAPGPHMNAKQAAEKIKLAILDALEHELTFDLFTEEQVHVVRRTVYDFDVEKAMMLKPLSEAFRVRDV